MWDTLLRESVLGGKWWFVVKTVGGEGTEVMHSGVISAVAVVGCTWGGRFDPAVPVSSVLLPMEKQMKKKQIK